MPIEIRHMIFSNQEVITAARHYYQRFNRSIPDNSAIRLDACAGVPVAVVISAAASKSRPPAEFRLTGEELLAAIILFCHTKRIPMPSRGAKEICLMGGRLTFVVTLSPQQPLIAQAS
jgi:hypothetical protein